MAHSRLSFVTLDVFTEKPFTGNPLAIVEVPLSAALSQDQKQKIAREFNYSETVFLHEREDSSENTWAIDIFTLDRELPFAGHPVIGTACHVLSSVSRESDEQVIRGTFITKAGHVELEYTVTDRTARVSIPHNIHIHQEEVSHDQVRESQPGLGETSSSPQIYPVVSIVKGMTFIMVELSSLEELAAVATTANRLVPQLDEGWQDSFVGGYFFVRLGENNGGILRLQSRMIEGTLEDPATGSATSGCCAYLAMQSGKPGQTSKFAVNQGVEMGRSSGIGVEATLADDGAVDRIVLIGSAVRVMEGRLTL
ncbi:hypothetical protein W97_07399 [Coniosporium apollinis CBS 100218]|uniref:Phenazine biosynthesis protein n=1 Tax=Coniosporium apollinis (strain CBS 100218) TaxID=1168221 RepID=R7Z167_CONA1|nr:uncharacterized protein W97_07399 [Coniosporium apollinis CBS 100218]EON67902.1 hypothetical protein W97_07399 [Coniosporium apollinis CBS 100218]